MEMSWVSITAKVIFIAIYSDYIARDSPNNIKILKLQEMNLLVFYLKWHELL